MCARSCESSTLKVGSILLRKKVSLDVMVLEIIGYT